MPGIAFEIAAEEGLVRKIQIVGDLLYAHVRVFEQRLGLEDHVAVDPFRDGFAADLLDERREVLGRDAELPGIESDAALLLVVFGRATA